MDSGPPAAPRNDSAGNKNDRDKPGHDAIGSAFRRLTTAYHMSSATRASSDMRLWSHGGSKTMVTLTLCDARHRGDRVLHPARHLAGDRAAGRRQGHVDGDVAVVVDLDPVDQAELVDVGRDFRIVDGLQRGDDVVGQAVELFGRDRGAPVPPAVRSAPSSVSVWSVTVVHPSREQRLGLLQGPRPAYRLLRVVL